LGNSSLFTREKYILIAKIAMTVAVGYALIQLLVIGGDTFVINCSDAIPFPLSLLTTITVFLLWRRFLPFSSGRPLWIWFLIGWGCWGIGETLHMIQYWITGDVPYPGLPDIFYTLGYIGLIVGLITRLRETNRHLQPRQWWMLLTTFLILLGLTYSFALLPVIQNLGENSLQSALDLFYPFGDLALIIVGMRLLIDYNTRQSRTGWRLIIIGFILMYIADLMYTYTTSIGLYYPDGKVNLITTLGYTFPNDFAYAFWMMGIYGLQVRLTARMQEDTIIQPILVENTHILLFLNKDLQVDEVSSNYSRVFLDTPSLGQQLAEVLPFKPSEILEIKSTLTSRGKFADLPMEVVDRKGKNRLAKLSGISMLDSQKVFSGALVVLRIGSEANNLDLELSDYQRSLIVQVRTRSGSIETRNVCAFLHAFFLPFFKRGYELMLENAGYQQGVNFEEFLNRESAKNNWKVKFESGSVSIDENITPGQLIQQLPAMLATSRTQLDKMSDPESVDIEVQKIKSGFSEEVMNNYYYIQHAWQNRGK